MEATPNVRRAEVYDMITNVIGLLVLMRESMWNVYEHYSEDEAEVNAGLDMLYNAIADLVTARTEWLDATPPVISESPVYSHPISRN